MNDFVHFPRPRVLSRVQTSAQSPASKIAPGAHSPGAVITPIGRQAAIENALSMALYFIRQPGDVAANVWAATARTNRALTLLKQASETGALFSTTDARERA